MRSVHTAGGQTKQGDWLYTVLERVRAGLGAAGVTAAFVEGLASMRALPAFAGSLATPLIVALSVLAFVVVSYIVDVPQSRELDVEK
jgi:hypothetical protein